MREFLVCQAHWQDDWCRLGLLENVEKAAEIRYGLSREEGFPSDACFRMDPDFPHDMLLTDCLKNSSGELVVSARVVDFLTQADVKSIEYLPVSVFDHRGQPVEEPYAIANPINPVECLDLDASEPTWNLIKKGQIRRVRKLVLDPERLDPTRRLFRCSFFTHPKIIHRDLASSLEASGFSGFSFLELEDFRG